MTPCRISSFFALCVLCCALPALAGSPSPAPAPLGETVLEGVSAVPPDVLVAWAADGSAFAVVTDDGTVRVFDSATGALRTSFVLRDATLASTPGALTAGGRRFVAAGNALEVYDVASGTRLMRDDTAAGFTAPAASRDGRHLAVLRSHETSTRRNGHTERVERHAVEVWDLDALEMTARWSLDEDVWDDTSGFETYARALVLSPDARHVWAVENRGWTAGCGGGAEWIDVRVFDRVSGEELTTWRESLPAELAEQAGTSDDGPGSMLMTGFLERVVVSPQLDRLAIVDTTLNVIAVDLAAFAAAPESGAAFSWHPADTWGRSLAVSLSSDGERLILASDAELRRVSLDTGASDLTSLPASEQRRWTSLVSGEQWLVVASEDAQGERSAELWSQATPEALACLWDESAPAVLSFSPDGSRMLRVRPGDATLEVWDTAVFTDPRLASALDCD